MLQYEIQNKIKRGGKFETVLMTKYIVSPTEISGIERFLGQMDNLVADNVRAAIFRTKRPYERKYKQDPEAPDGWLAFILFKNESTWLQNNCLNKLFTYDKSI